MSERNKTILSYFGEATRTEVLISCQDTGITAKLQVPALPKIPGKVFSFQHPLSQFENCQAIAKLAYSELLKLPPSTLAAIILSYLSKLDLRKDKLSATEANIFLCSLSVEKLIVVIRFLSSLSSFLAKKLPRLSLAEGNSQSLINWLYDSQAAISSPIAEKEDWASPLARSQNKGKQIIDSSLSPETKQEAAFLVKSLIEADIISPKLSLLFKQSYTGNNLVLMDTTMRNSLIKYLEKFPASIEAIKLIQLYRETSAAKTHQESIIAAELDSGSLSNFPASTTKKSLSEIIAEKKAQLAAKEQNSQAFIEELKEIEEEVDAEMAHEEELIEEILSDSNEEEVEELSFEAEAIMIERSNEEPEDNKREATDAFFSKLYQEKGFSSLEDDSNDYN